MVIGRIVFPPSPATFSLSELCKVTAFRGSFPFLVGLIRVLVGDIWRFGTPTLVVVMVVLSLGQARIAMVVVVVMVVTIQIQIPTTQIAATVIVGCGNIVICVANTSGSGRVRVLN